MIKQAIEESNLRAGFDMFLGIDAASDSFYNENKYIIKDKSTTLTSKDLISFYKTINEQFHLLYLEDGLSEDDWDGWKELYTAMSAQTMIIGDDLIATNPFRLSEAISKNAISAVIIKPNQIGTIIEAMGPMMILLLILQLQWVPTMLNLELLSEAKELLNTTGFWP